MCPLQSLCFPLTDCIIVGVPVGKSATRMFRFCAAATGSAFAVSGEAVTAAVWLVVLLVGRLLTSSCFAPRPIPSQHTRSFDTEPSTRCIHDSHWLSPSHVMRPRFYHSPGHQLGYDRWLLTATLRILSSFGPHLNATCGT